MSERKFREPIFGAAVTLALVVGIVFITEFRSFAGSLTGLLVSVLWNCLPVLVALALVIASRHSGPTIRFAGYGFSAGAAGLVVFGHILWAFDIGKTATGSSTAALMFLFLPAWAVILGAITAVLAGLIGFAWGPPVHPINGTRP